ncbi:hypothetical protein TrST_g10088 [Triparma strigata]|uniref:Uncharacterized protein n=1 Tax=Triparma strigata TaxID=1606541 RepID=A0A9W7E475_9STRA|nr:hypothetical protein TrST_g10088 [Triparma strigata]
MLDKYEQGPSQKESLHAELKEAVALLETERKAKEEAVALLEAERAAKEEAVALLEAERAANSIVEPFDRDNPRVKKVGPNVLSSNTNINNCLTKVTIHEEMEAFLEALLGNQTKVGKKLYQKIVG